MSSAVAVVTIPVIVPGLRQPRGSWRGTARRNGHPAAVFIRRHVAVDISASAILPAVLVNLYLTLFAST